MIRKILIVLGFLILIGCVSTIEREFDYSRLPLSDGELLKDKWSDLNRFAARYPFVAAKSSKAGCATVEYVITPEYKIRDIVVTSFSNKIFAQNSKKVISNWKWSELPQGLLSSAIKHKPVLTFVLNQQNYLVPRSSIHLIALELTQFLQLEQW